MIIKNGVKRAYCTFIIGQSNGVGQPQTGDPLGRTLLYLPQELQGAQKNIRRWNNTVDGLDAGSDFEVTNISTQSQKWGVEMGLLSKAAAHFGRVQYFAKFAVSGANISQFNPVGGSLIWPNLEIGTGLVVDWFNAKNIEVSYRVIWMQGESDCTGISGHSTDYEGDLRDVVDAFRAIRTELNNVPFIFSKIIPAQTAFYPTSAPVNAAFDTLVSEDPAINFTLSSTDYGTMTVPDGGHYNGASLITYGEGLFDFTISQQLYTFP